MAISEERAGRRRAAFPQSGGGRVRYPEKLMSGRDWKGIAKSSGLSLSAKEVEAAAEALENLQRVFDPLIRNLTPDMEPALQFDAEGESE